MNIDDASTQLLYTTVPIYAQTLDNKTISGTGFIFSVKEEENSFIPLLITNYHVLENTKAGFVEFHLSDENSSVSNRSVKVQFDRSVIYNNKLGILDLIAIPLASSLNDLQEKGKRVFFRSIEQNLIPSEEQVNDFAAVEDITFIGYPEGLYDEKNKLPIVRQGITATPIWNDFKGEENFLIDAGVFPGSSGSPVFIYNRGTYPTKNGIAVGSRLMFVGVIAQTILDNSRSRFVDLGVVINSRAILRELHSFIEKLKNNHSSHS